MSRIETLVLLTNTKTYDYEKGRVDLDKAIMITKEIEEMVCSDHELSYTEKSDNSSLLHMAINSFNTALVAYYVDMGINIDKQNFDGLTPEMLINTIDCPALNDAFYSSEEYLITNKVFAEFEDIESDTDSFENDVVFLMGIESDTDSFENDVVFLTGIESDTDSFENDVVFLTGIVD